MKFKELYIAKGSKIRRASWPEDQYFEVIETQQYEGTEWAFEPAAYGPSGWLKISKGRAPWWIPGNIKGDDWEQLF